MAEAVAFNRFLAIKDQSAFGVKATGLTQTVVPIREGPILNPNPFLVPRDDVANAVSPWGMHYQAPKIVPFNFTVVLINPTSANAVLRSLLRSIYGKETTATGPPITSTFDISDPLVDGGTDGTPANTVYARAMTLHEQSDKTDGTLIYADEVQDAVLEELAIVIEPDKPLVCRLRGMSSLFTPNASDVTPSNPDGSVYTFRHLKDTATSGLRVGSANPPTATDNVIFSRATITIRNTIRYEPFLGIGALQEVRKATRNDSMMMDVELVSDVEDDVASQYDAKNMTDDWAAGTDVNLRLLAQIDANNIFEFKSSATKAGLVNRGAFIESVVKSAPSKGAQQLTTRIRIAPTALTDTIMKLTRAS